VCLSSLKIDGKCILFAKKKLFNISGYSLPTLIKHKETEEIVELSLDSFIYQDDFEYNLEDILSPSKRNELKMRNQTMRSIYEGTTNEHA
jgi:hypothetical protein